VKTLHNNENCITFHHIYDTTWGCFVIYQDEKWIIFPQDFQPEVGRKYDVIIQWTMAGVFKYKGKRYSVARAHLRNSAGIIGAMLYKIDNKPQKLESPLAAALKKADIKEAKSC